MHLVRPHAPTQYLRIFVIVHITSFFITKSILDSYYHKSPKPQQIHQLKPQKSLREKLATSGVPDYSGASETLRTARERAVAAPPTTDSLATSSSSSASHTSSPESTNTADLTMAPKKENTKKAAGNAKKAEVAAAKAAAADAATEQNESSKWNQGAKSNKKQADAAEKKAQQAAAKAERERILAEEEKNAPVKPKSAGAKKAEKKLNDRAPASKGTLNLDDLDGDDAGKDGKPAQDGSKKETTLNASSIDAALDALNLTQSPNTVQIDRHPERRVKAAYASFEARRLPEIEQEHPGLRRNQRVEMCRREFEKSEENPFNQGHVGRFDMSREEMGEVRKKVRDGVEGYLGEK